MSYVGFLRLKQVLAIVPVGKTKWYQGVKQGIFPRPVKMGERVSLWKYSDIEALVQRIEEGQIGNEA